MTILSADVAELVKAAQKRRRAQKREVARQNGKKRVELSRLTVVFVGLLNISAFHFAMLWLAYFLMFQA